MRTMKTHLFAGSNEHQNVSPVRHVRMYINHAMMSEPSRCAALGANVEKS